jgi:NitT/TauT family transport system substrate-binding protein
MSLMLLILAFCLGLFPVNTFGQSSVKVSYGSLGISQVILPLGVHEGIFKKNNLAVEAVYIAGRSVWALVSGEVKFGFMGGPPAILARVGGSDIVILAGLNKLDQILVTGPSVNKAQDLIGKKGGISQFGTTSDYGMRLGLKRLKLVPQKDVAIVQVGDTNARIGALISGAIQVATLNAGEEAAVKKAGMKILEDNSDIPFPGNTIVTTDSYIKANRQNVKQFVRSIVDIVKFVKTKPEETKRFLAGFYREQDRSSLDSRYKTMYDTYPDYPYITKESIEGVLGILRDDGKLKASVDGNTFLDASFLKDIENENR